MLPPPETDRTAAPAPGDDRAPECDDAYRLLFDASPRPMWVYDAETLRFLAVNDAAVRDYGYSRDEFLAMTLREIRPPDALPMLEHDIAELAPGHGSVRQREHRTRDGRIVHVEISSHSLTFRGRPARLVLATDLTEQFAAAAALRSSESRFRAIFDHAAVGITLLDDAGKIIATNPAFQRLLGYDADELRGRPSGERSPGEDADATRRLVREITSGARESGTIEKRYIRKDGRTVWASLTVSRTEHEGRDCLIGMILDISSQKELEAQLTHQAFHDPLTGLANRALFRDRVEHALARAERQRERVAVIFLDLDDFKTVNDTLGHGEGDQLLCAAASRLLNATRGCDTVARLGGDEFGVLLEGVRDDSEAVVVADRIAMALRAPLALQRQLVSMGASMGIARAGIGDGAEEVLRNADVAMYTAKNRGKGRYEIFAPAMHAALVDRLAIERDLRTALNRGEFELYYQPIVELDGGRVVGVEALVRWIHPKRGILLPNDFIAVAEETGIIVPLGAWVLREACRQGARWQTQRDTSLSVTVNLSGRQLQAAGLVESVAEALDTSGLDPSNLVLEITESVIMQNTEPVLQTLRSLKGLGVRLAIDDFGTGYSSLGYLQRFPIDVLKIDKTFVDRVTRGGNDTALARTIIALGEMLALRTVAEGIEDSQQQTLLQELGCQLGQGYLFARPLPASEGARLVCVSPASTTLRES